LVLRCRNIDGYYETTTQVVLSKLYNSSRCDISRYEDVFALNTILIVYDSVHEIGMHKHLLQTVSKKLNIRKMDDWYQITQADVRAQGGEILLDTYGSLADVLKALYPFHYWDPSKFQAKVSHPPTIHFLPLGAHYINFKQQPNRWTDINLRKKFFIEAAKKLGIKKVRNHF
jgi:hypothetical protein